MDRPVSDQGPSLLAGQPPRLAVLAMALWDALASCSACCACCYPMVPPQYYNFIRLGQDGFLRIFQNLMRVYDYLKEQLEATGEISCPAGTPPR